MGLFDWLLGKNKKFNSTSAQNIDLFTPYFSGLYNAELNNTYVSIAETYARHLSKIKPKVYLKNEQSENLKYINELLNLRMNPLMSASQGWETIAKNYYLTNNSLVFLEWDYLDFKKPLKAIWPLDPEEHSLSVVRGTSGKLYIKFYLDGRERSASMDDVVLLTRNADPSKLFGQRSKAVDTILKVMQTNYEGIEQAIITSAYIRFLVATTSPMTDENKKKKAKAFADAYLGKDSTGVAFVDSAEKIIPVNSKATYANKDEMDFFKKEIYHYFGANDKFLESSYDENEFQSVYESVFEPFISKLLDEINYKILTRNQRNAGNEIRIDTSMLHTASLGTRIKIAHVMMKLPLVKPNQVSELLYLPKFDHGDNEYEFLNYKNTDSEDNEDNKEDSNDDKKRARKLSKITSTKFE